MLKYEYLYQSSKLSSFSDFSGQDTRSQHPAHPEQLFGLPERKYFNNITAIAPPNNKTGIKTSNMDFILLYTHTFHSINFPL
jgi:hypothetical protein